MSFMQLADDQILGRIRFDADTQRGSVLDVVQLVTGCDQRNASTVFHRVLSAYPDIRTHCVDVKFAGVKQKPTKAAHVGTLIEIAFILPGKHATQFRRDGIVVLCRALGGDLSLVEEIRQRHAAVAGTEEQAAFLAGTGVSVAEANGQALVPAPPPEVAALDLEERRARVQIMTAEAARMVAETERMVAETEAMRRAGGHETLALARAYREEAARETDVRQRLFLEDSAKNIVRTFTPGAGPVGVLALPGPDGTDPNRPVSLSGVAADIGYFNTSRAELQAIGRAAAQMFREAHDGEGPPKHTQFVDGAARQVSSYFERDRPLLERAVRSIMG